MEHSSAFSKPDWSSRDHVFKNPPLFHVSTYVTGGLQGVFKRIRNIKSSIQTVKHKKNVTGDQFCPSDGLVLSRRYRLTDKLSTQGQFAVIVGAKDEFCQDRRVIIKVMHKSFYAVGLQERHCLWRLAMADPCKFSHTVHLLNSFTFDGHCCLVFEFLHPNPITDVFEEYNLPKTKLIKAIRKVAFQMLKVLGFLQQKNTIHADIKPENILLQDVHDVGSLKVIDFGNAIHHIHKEVSLYYHDFELQTLLYRAPEVMFGIPFGTEVDMWSLGCVLAELYLGESLFSGTTKEQLLHSMTKLLGRFPASVFHRGKFFDNYPSLILKTLQPDATICVMQRLRDSRDFAFANFLAELLRYNPDERLTPTRALRHSFLAPEFSLNSFMPSNNEHEVPSSIAINPKYYRLSPKIPAELKRQNPSTFDLLNMGTRSNDSQQIPCNKIAKVCPFDPNLSKVQSPCAAEKHPESSPSQRATSDHRTMVTAVKYLTEGAADFPYSEEANTDNFDNIVSSSAATKINLPGENQERKMTISDNDVKLHRIIAMISVEQERVEEAMEVKQKWTEESYSVRKHVKKSCNGKLKNQNKKRLKNNSNFLCEYASDSSDDCSVVERTEQEGNSSQVHDGFTECLSQVGNSDHRQISKSRITMYKESEHLNSVQCVQNNDSSQIIKTMSEKNETKMKNNDSSQIIKSMSEKNETKVKNNDSSQIIKSMSEKNETKDRLVRTDSKIGESRCASTRNTKNEVLHSTEPCCDISEEQNQRKLLPCSRPKRLAKRKLLFSRAFPPTPNKVNTSKSLIWNQKYLKVWKGRKNTSQTEAINTYNVIDVDPFEFKVTPMKHSKTSKKATVKEKRPTTSRKKFQNTDSVNKDKEWNAVVSEQGKDHAENPTLKNLDIVFKKYNKMKDISPIHDSSTDSYPQMSETATKKRCLFVECDNNVNTSPDCHVQSSHSKPRKRKCVDKQLEHYKGSAVFSHSVNQSDMKVSYPPSKKSAKLNKTGVSDFISDRCIITKVLKTSKCLTIGSEAKSLNMKSHPSTNCKALKTIRKTKGDEFLHIKCMDDSSCSPKQIYLAETKSQSKARQKTLHPGCSRFSEVKNKTARCFVRDFPQTEDSKNEIDSTQSVKNTVVLDDENDDIILLDI